MKRFLLAVVTACLLFFATVPNTGCAGSPARNAVVEGVASADPVSLRKNIEFAISQIPDEDERYNLQVRSNRFFEDIRSGERIHMQINAIATWPVMRQLALDGIELRAIDGQIGPNVATILIENVNQWDRIFSHYNGAPP